MTNNNTKSMVKLIVMIISVMAAVLVMRLVYVRYYRTAVEERTHEQITSYIDNELQYEAETYDAELEKLNELLTLPFISDSDKGHVYERMAQIYKFKDDTLNFYHTMGNALYYLEKSGNRSVAVNIYEDIANYYITDNNFSQAERILEKAYEVCPIEDISDKQVRSYAYRMQAMISRHNGEFESARRQIDLSTRIANECSDTFWYPSYIAINDAVLAGIAYDEGLYKETHTILDHYKDSEFFSAPIYADIITRDFVLPYYDTACRLAARDGDIGLLNEYLAKCRSASEAYGFQKKELGIILDLLKDDHDLPPKTKEELIERTMQIYAVITQTQSDEYAAMINSPLENGMREQAQLYAEEQARIKRNRIYVIVAIVIVVIIAFLSFLIIRALTDALTRIWNRRALDQYLHILDFLKIRACIAMLDVDNFKQVNDNFGHDQGDMVLMRLGSILKGGRSRNIKCFRYGGEEFVMLFKNFDMGTVLRIADSIRKDIGWQQWEFPGHITVSIGVAQGRATKDTVRLADENMYHSKTHGKNAVSYDINGKKTILKDGDPVTGAEDS